MQQGNKKIVILVVVAVVFAVAAGIFGIKYAKLRNDPTVLNQATTQRLTEKVGKLYNLPQDEQPTIAEVKDKSKLGDQPFFKSAENGDYILIYTKAQLAILYREKANKLINVGPITIQDQKAAATQQEQKPAEAKPVKVSVKVINGTTQAGRASGLGQDLSSKLADKVAVDANYENAKNRTVAKTIVVDVNGNKAAQAKEIAAAVGGDVGALPAGESKPAVDILVIAGRQ